MKLRGRVKRYLITQVRVCCVCAHWVSLLADRSIDCALYTRWQLTDQLTGLRKAAQPPPPAALPPFTATRFATTRTARNSQQCISLSFRKPLVSLNFTHSIDKAGINFPEVFLRSESTMQLIYCKWIAYSINKLLKDLNAHTAEQNHKLSAAQKHNLISSKSISKITQLCKRRKWNCSREQRQLQWQLLKAGKAWLIDCAICSCAKKAQVWSSCKFI